MPDIYFANYASGRFLQYQQRNNRFIRLFARPKAIFSYTKDILITEHAEFCNKNREVLTQSRGDGYWLWKPYIIRNALSLIPEGAYLIYYDSGEGLRFRVWSQGTTFIEWTKKHAQSFIPGVHIPEHGYHHQWCKPSVLRSVLTTEQIKQDISQIQATFSIWRNDENSRKFVTEWLELAQKPGFIDDSESAVDKLERSDYKEHRHDQSLLSCLCIKYGIKTINQPDELVPYNKSLSFVELYLKQKESFMARMVYGLARTILSLK
ncbi:TPA: hypothetical protein NJT27_004890 [Klebsiella pneumoniae]|nr:hypothetical protein [Klebsiella pneumoniae]HCG2949840.1 hypothetical protein [Klebsiella pneumoniae]